MVDAGRPIVRVCPDNGPGWRDLHQFYQVCTGMVAGHHGVPVWKPLDSAGVVDWPAGKIIIRQLPNLLPGGAKLDDQVAERAADERVPIVEADRRERHVRSLHFPYDLAVRRVLADHPVEGA